MNGDSVVSGSNGVSLRGRREKRVVQGFRSDIGPVGPFDRACVGVDAYFGESPDIGQGGEYSVEPDDRPQVHVSLDAIVETQMQTIATEVPGLDDVVKHRFAYSSGAIGTSQLGVGQAFRPTMHAGLKLCTTLA